MRRREDHPEIPEYQVAAKPSGRADRAGEANADNLPLQHGWVQGPVGVKSMGSRRKRAISNAIIFNSMLYNLKFYVLSHSFALQKKKKIQLSQLSPIRIKASQTHTFKSTLSLTPSSHLHRHKDRPSTLQPLLSVLQPRSSARDSKPTQLKTYNRYPRSAVILSRFKVHVAKEPIVGNKIYNGYSTTALFRPRFKAHVAGNPIVGNKFYNG